MASLIYSSGAFIWQMVASVMHYSDKIREIHHRMFRNLHWIKKKTITDLIANHLNYQEHWNLDHSTNICHGLHVEMADMYGHKRMQIIYNCSPSRCVVHTSLPSPPRSKCLAWLFDLVNVPIFLFPAFPDSPSRMIMATLGHFAPRGRNVMGCSSGTY